MKKKTNLKTTLCNKLVEEGRVRDGDVIRHSYSTNRLENGDKNMGRIENHKELSPTLDTRCDCLGIVISNDEKPKVIGGIGEKKSNSGTQWYQQDRIYDNKTAISISTCCQPYYLDSERERESDRMNLRIRKLVPVETTKLMGFERKDHDAMREVGQSDAQIYHECGDSIVVTCLMGIFGKMFFTDKELKEKLESYVESVRYG